MKQTEVVGVEDTLIPDDWEVKRLGEVCDTSSGGTPSRNNETFFRGNIKWFTTTELRDCFLYDSVEHITQKAVDLSSAKLFPKNTLLMAMYGATIGRLGILTNQATTNQACCAIFPHQVDVLFLFYYLLYIRESIISLGSGAGQPNISQEIVKGLNIILPPLPEQQRIAKALSDVDALISTTEKLLQKKKNIKQGAMQNLLTGKKRLPGFAKSTRTKMTELGEIPEDWEVKSLGEMLKIGHGKDYKNLKSGDVPVYGTGGYMTSVNDFLYEGETVCIGRKGTIDKPQYHSGKIWTVDTLFYTYDFKSLNPKFLFYKFCLIDWLSMNEASGVPSLTAKNIEDIQIALPPEEEQTAIANVLSSMDKEIETLNTKLEKYRNLKTAMMQQLLTGKIRL